MPPEGYKTGEVADLGEAIYEEKIRHLVEPSEKGKLILIDVESGDYEIDENHFDAFDRLKERQPNAVAYMGRIGYRAAFSLGGRIERDDG